MSLSAPDPAGPNGIRPRLLIVDDQPVNIQVLYQLFARDHDVFMATSGRQAIEVCRRELPDLVLLDIMMSDLDGLEVCRALKGEAATRDIPVIFVTGQESPEEETRGLAAGAVDFISKPINPAVVQARVHTHLTLKAQADRLRDLAFVDGLTGVANRRRFDERLAQEWRACARTREPLAVALVDVDHFKQFNDYYGHQAGDACLQTVATQLVKVLRRPRDFVARYGGEEFVCLLSGVQASRAGHAAELLRASVEAAAVPHQRSDCAQVVTASIGLAVAVPTADTSPAELLAAADARLYQAKQAGRNRSCVG
ncbi:MAG: diguanylate cyclase [Nevskia sp.]|nr:diguanylate cyclase [Nevskia sp.]